MILDFAAKSEMMQKKPKREMNLSINESGNVENNFSFIYLSVNFIISFGNILKLQ